jgi:hypothetical protein
MHCKSCVVLTESELMDVPGECIDLGAGLVGQVESHNLNLLLPRWAHW